MKVIVMKKATVTNLIHGISISADIEKFENVSSIAEETQAETLKYYQITYTQGSSTLTAQRGQNDYIVNILP